MGATCSLANKRTNLILPDRVRLKGAKGRATWSDGHEEGSGYALGHEMVAYL